MTGFAIGDVSAVDRAVVIGVGNPWRRDDGVGFVVAAECRARLSAAVDVRRCDGDPGRLLDAWADHGLAVVIDATVSDEPAGTIGLVRLDSITADSYSARPCGTHGVGLREAVGLGLTLARLPDRLVVVGIEAGDHGLGEGLTAPVADAVVPAVALVVGIMRAELGDAAVTAPRAVRGRRAPAQATH